MRGGENIGFCLDEALVYLAQILPPGELGQQRCLVVGVRGTPGIVEGHVVPGKQMDFVACDVPVKINFFQHCYSPSIQAADATTGRANGSILHSLGMHPYPKTRIQILLHHHTIW